MPNATLGTGDRLSGHLATNETDRVPEYESICKEGRIARCQARIWREKRFDQGIAYREQVLAIEPHATEHVQEDERHGSVRSLFTLWLSANMGLPVWLVGALAVTLGLGFADGVAAILLGNLVGCALLALTASMGPEIGVPQLPFTAHSFGARGKYLPALLNWVSTSGWYAVNSIVGALAIVHLTAAPFWLALLILSAAQILVGVYGYNFIHRLEAISAALLAAIFVIMTVVSLPKANFGLVSTLSPADHLGLFVLMTTAVASYVFSWAPYASDYARYLPPATSKLRVFGTVFGGAFIGCFWLQFLGIAVATLGLKMSPIDLVVSVMGPVWVVALLAVVLGTIAADALNVYTGALRC